MNDTKPLVHHGETAAAASKAGSPFIPMFEQFRSELDAHYDTRERIIKASRDITAASKKMYVSNSLCTKRRLCGRLTIELTSLGGVCSIFALQR